MATVRFGVLLVATITLASGSANAQMDFSGEWQPDLNQYNT
jgi:hypothetical protein